MSPTQQLRGETVALTVNTNISAMSAVSSLSGAGVTAAMDSLSSGSRNGSAVDVAIGEALNAEVMAEEQGMRNANDGISVAQTAEGASNEVADILSRIRELAVQSASETLANSERAYIQDEFTQLVAEVDRIAGSAEFNGVALADGSNTVLTAQVGTTAADAIGIPLGDLRATALGIDLGSIDLSTAGGAFAAIDDLDAAIDTVGGYRASLGSASNQLDSAISNSSSYVESMRAAESQNMDADFAEAAAELSKQQIMQQAGIAVLAQANSMSQHALALLE